jgi:hypothetical protein
MDELETLLKKRLIEKISAGEKPRIAVIFPRSGIVLEDLYGGLGKKQSLYSFHPHPCPINNPEAIRDKLEQLDKMGFDAIALIRGGGKYLEELDSRMVIKACAALSTPLLVAAGHFVDNPLIQHVASKDCGTPTMLGVYLAEMKEKSYLYNHQESLCPGKKSDKMNNKKNTNVFTYFLWFLYTTLLGCPFVMTVFNYIENPLTVLYIVLIVGIISFLGYLAINRLYLKSYAEMEWNYANRKNYREKQPYWKNRPRSKQNLVPGGRLK